MQALNKTLDRISPNQEEDGDEGIDSVDPNGY
jgi:hypothetical protein